MNRSIKRTVVALCISVLACGGAAAEGERGQAPRQSRARTDVVPVASRSVPTMFPFWSAEDYADIGRDAPIEASGVAVPVAPGYFVVPCGSVGAAAVDLSADPRVFIANGAEMHEGRLVDIDRERCIGLVRSSFAPPAYMLAASSEDGRSVSLVAVVTAATMQYTREKVRGTCERRRLRNSDGDIVGVRWMCVVPTGLVPGVVLLDPGTASLVGMVAPSGEGSATVWYGRGVNAIRALLHRYRAGNDPEKTKG